MSQADGTPPETLELIADRLVVERMTGIEPASSAWKADILPLNYIRISVRAAGLEPTPLAASASLAGLRFHSQSIANMTQAHRLPLYLLSYARILPARPIIRYQTRSSTAEQVIKKETYHERLMHRVAAYGLPGSPLQEGGL